MPAFIEMTVKGKIGTLISDVRSSPLVRYLHSKEAFDHDSGVLVDATHVDDAEFSRMSLRGVIEFSIDATSRVNRAWLTKRGMDLLAGTWTGWGGDTEEATCPFRRDI